MREDKHVMKIYLYLVISFLISLGLFPSDLQAQDTDGDDIVNSIDLDDDNDGILDTNELGDTDNDGRANALDLDSDKDGCPDAIEGGANFINTDVYGSDRLIGGVDGNGVPIVASSNGQSVGFSTDASQATDCADPCADELVTCFQYPISSSIVESDCKHLIKDRMEQSCKRW